MFFFNDTSTTEIYTLSLHDALPIWHDVVLLDRSRFPSDTNSTHAFVRGGVVQLSRWGLLEPVLATGAPAIRAVSFIHRDRKSTRLNSSHANISYAVFCLKKKHTYI